MREIEFIGHAGLAVRQDGHLLLCDPWLSSEGAYNGSWFPYPEYPDEIPAEFYRPSALYISHEHLDHLDPAFLARVDKDVPVLTGRFGKRRIVRRLRKLGFRDVREFDGFEAHRIAPGFEIRIGTPTFNCPPHWFDSCAIIELDGFKLFNMNDAGLALPMEELRNERFDLFLGQASPAIWFPLTYSQYSEEQRRELMAARRESATESFITAVNALRPKFAIPFAGPPVFFEDRLAEFFLGPDSMFNTAPVALERLHRETDVPGDVLYPGDRIRWNGGLSIDRHPAYADFDYERDRRAYFEAHVKEKRAVIEAIKQRVSEPKPGLYRRFSRRMTPLVNANPEFCRHIGMRVLFDVSGPEGGKWVLDFTGADEPVYPYEEGGPAAGYTFEVESRYVNQVILDELSWEDLFLSLRFTAYRTPDRYNQHLFTFLKMCDQEALERITACEHEADLGEVETFELEHRGKRYEVQRYCPHAGADLKQGTVEDGAIVCPNHHWRFKLSDGACANSSSHVLHCREIEHD